jgi:AcrR family transcriptional regulator
MGLLHNPLKEGFKSSFFDERHLRMLGRIRYLREQEKLSLLEIKQTLQGQQPADKSEVQQNGKEKKEQITDTAIRLFASQGYQDTKISDITDALGIGKGTFYLYFKDKRELFLECIERMTLFIIPRERWEEIRREHEPIRRIRKRTEVFLEAFPKFIGILNLIRYAMRSDDQVVAKKAKNTFSLLVSPIIKDISWGIRHGFFRQVNEELLAYYSLSMAEMLGYRLMVDSRYTLEQGVDALMDLLVNAIALREEDEPGSDEPGFYCCEVVDRHGTRTVLRDIRFKGERYLLGKVGEGMVKANPGNIASLRVEEGSEAMVVLVMKNGDRISMHVHEEMSVTGTCGIGEFSIPLKKVSHIAFLEEQLKSTSGEKGRISKHERQNQTNQKTGAEKT